MFENMFKKDPAAAAAPVQSATPVSAGVPGDDHGLWHDRIQSAHGNDAELLDLARQAPAVNLKIQAVQALTHEESLRQAMHDFRDLDKRLYRAAKSRWEEASGRRLAVDSARTLLAGARALLDGESVPANRIVELDREWSALNPAYLEAPLLAEFADLRAQLGTRVRVRGESEQAIVRWLAALDKAIERAGASLSGVAQGDVPPGEASAAASALLELLGGIPEAGEARCVEKTDAATRTLALASSVVQRAEFLLALPATGAADEADEKLKIGQWRSFPEVAATELQSVLAQRFADWRNAGSGERVREHEARRAREKELGAEKKKQKQIELQRHVDAAEAAHAAGNVNELTHQFSLIDRALKAGPAGAALAKRIDILRAEQKRLRDWQRWSGRQGREQLVVEAQALAAASAGKIALKAHAEAIDKLRERWKELDKLGGATNQALWLAFDAALKTAHAPVAAHLSKLKAARSENLAARNQIIEALVQTAAHVYPSAPETAAEPAAAPDWRAVARTVEEAQTAWRKLGPVEHTVPRAALQGDGAVTNRYAQAMQALKAPLEAAYGAAMAQRERFIADAKALGGDQVLARDVPDKVRALQSQWQAHAKSLTLPRADERRLWDEFKRATDGIFAARDAARSAKDAEWDAKLKAREEIIARLDAVAAGGGAQEIRRALTEAEAAWRAAAEVPKPQLARIEARYRAARETASKRIGEAAAKAAQARFDALIEKMALCHERECAIGSAQEVATDLEARWHAIEGLPEAWKAGMEARFHGNAPAGAGQLPDTLLNLEVACGIDSPAECLADRQQLKLRALKSAMEGRQAVVTTPADVERWLLAAAATPNPDTRSRERLERIIAAVRVRR
jgi:DNA repair protein SbcC/Rad50